MSYAYEPDDRLWLRPGAPPAYDYSDGDEVEQRLGVVIETADDIAVGSVELAGHIDDWASLYHLSPRRPDALRPVEHLLTGRVLEVGAGCGAITRYLGEIATSVVAVESSRRRARIAASRVRDLENVAVHVDTLADLDVPGGFDAVTLVGVLEYSRLYGGSGGEVDPVDATLARCRELLAPGGTLIVAIENQHGLKYVAGAPEDHLGRAFVGIEDGYTASGPVTFGREELERRLRGAGYGSVEVLYPFPDYKHARAVITEAGLRSGADPVVDVLRVSGAPLQDRDYRRTFSEELAWTALVRNGLGAALANSFVAVASQDGDLRAVDPDHLLTVYATERRRPFSKQTLLRTVDGGGMRAERRRLHPEAAGGRDEPYRMVLEDEPVLAGWSYLRGLQQVLNAPGWSAVDVAAWARPWTAMLDSLVDAGGGLPPSYVDGTPNNIIVGPDGSLRTFDLEWVADGPVQRSFVVVRGLFTSLAQLRSVAAPAAGTPVRLVELVGEAAALLGVDDPAVQAALDAEAALQSAVGGHGVDATRRALSSAVLAVRVGDLLAEAQEAERRLQEAERRRDEAQGRAHELESRLHEAHGRLHEAQGRLHEAQGRLHDTQGRLHDARSRLQELEGRLPEAERRLRDAEASAASLRAERDGLHASVGQVRQELDVVRASTSWRVTAPLRRLGPLRTAVQGPVSSRRSLRDVDNWRALGRSLRTHGVAGTVRRVQTATSAVHAAEDRAYATWVEQYDTLSADDLRAARAMVQELPVQPSFTIVVPVFSPRPEDLRRAVESVVDQAYDRWQLVLVDDASPDEGTAALLAELAERDGRIVVVTLEVNTGIAGATEAGRAAAEGDYLAFLDHDDELAPHALAVLAREIALHPDADVLYSDEDKIDASGVRSEPYFKPDFDPELLLAQNYFNHLTVVRADLVQRVGGVRQGFEGAQDHDLVLRCVRASAPERVRHVPHVLYHWRQHAAVRSFSRDQMERAASAGRRAVAEHLADDPLFDDVVPHPRAALWHRISWRLPAEPPAVTALIPTRDRLDLLQACVDGLLHRTDYPALEVVVLDNDSVEPDTVAYLEELQHDPRVRVLRCPGPFNYSALNNHGVAQVATPLVLLLNNDVVVREADWLRRMVALAHRPRAGAVGARLLYGDGRVQHAGVVLGVGGVAGHAQKYLPETAPGYFGRLVLTREVSAATGACLLMWTDLYREVGGLDERNLQIAFNDVDLCLRMRSTGRRVLWSAESELFHLESVSRGAETTPEKVRRFNAEASFMKARWGEVLEQDPAYSPNLTLLHEDYGLAFPPRARLPWR